MGTQVPRECALFRVTTMVARSGASLEEDRGGSTGRSTGRFLRTIFLSKIRRYCGATGDSWLGHDSRLHERYPISFLDGLL